MQAHQAMYNVPDAALLTVTLNIDMLFDFVHKFG